MEKYESIHSLGRGACGAVYLVRHKESRKLFALKKIELDETKKTRTKEAVSKEAKILKQLRHPHIVLYWESFFDPAEEFLYIIQDYCDGGTLADKIKEAARKSRHFEEPQIMNWFTQIIMAVQYIHSKKVLHRDLKSENVFLTKRNVAKIGDFGISKMLESTIDVAKTVVGTPSYLSPELCQDIPYSSKSDMWAVGCLLYEMCALNPPFDAQNLISLFFKIIKGEFEPVPSHYSAALHGLVNSLLVTRPDDRPSASAILNTALTRAHLARFIEEQESLLQQKGGRDDSSSQSPHCLRASAAGDTPALHNSGKSPQGPALPRDKGQVKTAEVKSSGKPAELVERLDAAGTTGGRKDQLDVPTSSADAASDYSDDFDDSGSEEEDIPEELEAADNSDLEDEERAAAAGDHLDYYADDFEECDSGDDLDQLVSLAKEAQDIESVDDWFADSLSEMHRNQTEIFQKHCQQAFGGRNLKEVHQLVHDGTLTEEDLRPQLELRRTVGADSAEICHLDIGELPVT